MPITRQFCQHTLISFCLPDADYCQALRAANRGAGLEPGGVVFALVGARGAFDEGGACVGRLFRILVGFHVLSS